MKCPTCGFLNNDARVIDSRSHGLTVKRRRVCDHCKSRYNTFEVSEREYNEILHKQRYMTWTDGETRTLVNLYQEGYSKVEIAKLFGRSRMSVSRKLDKLMESKEYFKVLEQIVS